MERVHLLRAVRLNVGDELAREGEVEVFGGVLGRHLCDVDDLSRAAMGSDG